MKKNVTKKFSTPFSKDKNLSKDNKNLEEIEEVYTDESNDEHYFKIQTLNPSFENDFVKDSIRIKIVDSIKLKDEPDLTNKEKIYDILIAFYFYCKEYSLDYCKILKFYLLVYVEGIIGNTHPNLVERHLIYKNYFHDIKGIDFSKKFNIPILSGLEAYCYYLIPVDKIEINLKTEFIFLESSRIRKFFFPLESSKDQLSIQNFLMKAKLQGTSETYEFLDASYFEFDTTVNIENQISKVLSGNIPINKVNYY